MIVATARKSAESFMVTLAQGKMETDGEVSCGYGLL